MATLHLVRHGHHDWLQRGFPGRNPGVHLSEQGVVDAVKVSEWLKDLPISAIISSPLERAQETAGQLAKRLGMEIRTEMDFNEFDFGTWNGMTFPELRAQPGFQTWETARCMCQPPNGETLIQVQARVVNLLHRLAAEFGDKQIALFGHADPIKTAVFYAVGGPLDYLPRIEIDPASVSTLEITDCSVRAVRVNYVVS